MTSDKQKIILLCDDDEGIVDVTRIVLEDMGFQVITISDGEEVIPTVKQSRPDLILLDLWMPIMSGEEILQELKKHEQLKNIPVIVISASKDTAQVAYRAQASDFLSKPFDIENLEQIVKKYLN